MTKRSSITFVSLLLFFLSAISFAEKYPTKPVRLIEPFGARGGVEVLARPIAKKLSELWGQEVIVENHPGAGSTVAPALVAKSQPDGYTLLVNSSAQAYSAALLKKLPYDPVKDFIPITPLTSQPYVLITANTSGITNVQELIAAAKSKPGQLKFGSAGIGTGSHLAVEKFNQAAGIAALHVPAGPNDAITDVITHNVAGETTYMIAPIPLSSSYIREGKLRALGTTGTKRSTLLPDVPTIAEAGVEGFSFPIWYGVWAPAGTSNEIIERIANGIARALAEPDLKEWLTNHGAETMSMTQTQFARFVQSESDSAKQIIQASNKAETSELKPGEGYVEVTGGRIWYRIVGTGNRVPLILIHGGPGFPSYYLEPLAKLADERPVIFYDQLGSGKSDHPDQNDLWRVERFVDELAQLRKSLGLKNVHILGHSWGTMLTADYLLTKPDGIRSLILAGPCLSVSRWLSDAKKLVRTLPESIQMVIAKNEKDRTYDSQEYQAAMMEFYKRYYCRKDPWPDLVTRSFTDLNQSVYMTMWGPSEFTATGSLRTYERSESLKDVNVPVLFTTGRYDEATPSTVEYYRSLVPGARLKIFEQSGHLTMQDEPEAYVQAIRDFLREVEQQ